METNHERGAVLVHTAIAMLGLMSFSALAIDYGAFWVARGQAQNAADAAALAGAISLAYDDPNDIPRAQNAAVLTGAQNLVLGSAPSIVAATDVTVIPCPPGGTGLPDQCVRANVYRSTSRSNALPTFFAQVMGISSQDVRATATAQIYTGNAVDCLKPWAVADKWAEHWENGAPSTAPWTVNSTFDKYMKQGTQWVRDPSVTSPDVYIAPTATSPGTGFTPFDSQGNQTGDYGLELTLKIGSAQNRMSAGWFQALDLMNPDGTSGSGGSDYRANISGCNAHTYTIGDSIPVETGNMIGPTGQGVGDLLAKDPGATWNTSSQSITGSCAPGVCADGQWYAHSPRIVPVVLFDIDSFYAGSPNGKTSVTISNLMGFFVEGMGGSANKDVVGRLVEIPGLKKSGNTVTATSSFLRTVLLVR
jgi:Flp pilus assembly protein TadG